jgi:hypothetical protein
LIAGEQDRVRRVLFDVAAVDALRQVIGVLGSAGAPVAPVKGVMLARRLYDDICERPYRDLDLLISRRDLAGAVAAVASHGWRIRHSSLEMGELEFEVNSLVVEIHAEFGRRDLSRLTSDDVLARGVRDTSTFSFEVCRIDDIDHFFLIVANVTKKTFTYASGHHPADLERLLVLLEPRWPELVDRAKAAGFVTALRSTMSWMIEEHGSHAFRRLASMVQGPDRHALLAAVRWYRQRARRHRDRLTSASGMLGLALATLTPDDGRLRVRGLARLVRRGAYRRLGWNPG